MPGAFNAMSARVIEDLGFEAVYITGAGVTNMNLGLPDLGFISLHELAHHTAQIRDAVSLPLIVDIDTGFGNALNVRQTITTIERAGADAVQIEDQIYPKRCGHFSGKEVEPVEQMLAKIRAIADARLDDDFVIIARTDSRAVHGFDEAVRRAQLFSEAGADVLFIEATESVDEVKRLPRLLDKPQLVNVVVGGKTPVLDQQELAGLGYSIVLYANAALQGAVLGMQNSLGALRRHGRLDEDPTLVVSFKERQRLVNKPLFDELERKYAG